MGKGHPDATLLLSLVSVLVMNRGMSMAPLPVMCLRPFLSVSLSATKLFPQKKMQTTEAGPSKKEPPRTDGNEREMCARTRCVLGLLFFHFSVRRPPHECSARNYVDDSSFVMGSPIPQTHSPVVRFSDVAFLERVGLLLVCHALVHGWQNTFQESTSKDGIERPLPHCLLARSFGSVRTTGAGRRRTSLPRNP